MRFIFEVVYIVRYNQIVNLIILPGNSKKYNEQWLYDSEKNYKDLFETVTTHYYKHWEEDSDSIDIDHEVKKLENNAKDLGDYVIFAKSAGTVTTIKAISQNKISPKKCIFVGCPFKWAIENDAQFVEEFNKIEVPVLFIQQTDDPFFKYEDLEKFINKNPLGNYQLIEIAGDNHAYDDYEEIKQMIIDFV